MDFVDELPATVSHIRVLEVRVGAFWTAAPKVLPQANVVAITGMALINRTFGELLALCLPESLVLVLGPSTPLSPVLFDRGVHILSGSVVEDVDAVLRAVSQGAGFHQVRRQGERLVTMAATQDAL
jgi:uncharacterized protein (DUF4213/DUF364 family)